MQPVSVSSAVAGDTLFCIYCEARKGVPTGDDEGLGVFFVRAALSLPLATVPLSLLLLQTGNQTAVRKIVRKNLIIKGKALTLQSPLLLLCR